MHPKSVSSPPARAPSCAPARAACHAVLATVGVLLLAVLAYGAVRLSLARARAHACAPPRAAELERAMGYVLIIVGYLLLPGVGALLVRRQRCLARQRALLLAESDAADGALSSRFGDALQHGVRWLFGASRAILHDVNRSTTRTRWAGDRDTQCAVCLSQLQHKCAVRILPCRHAFHVRCADLWLVQGANNSCPLCWSTVCKQRSANMQPLSASS